MLNSKTGRKILAPSLMFLLLGQIVLPYAAVAEQINNSVDKVASLPPSPEAFREPDASDLQNDNDTAPGDSLAVAPAAQTSAMPADANAVSASPLPAAPADANLVEAPPALAAPADANVVGTVGGSELGDSADAALVQPASLPDPAGAQVSQDTPPLRLSGSASVSPAESEKRIEDLTKQIMLKTIELEKFNLRYTQEVAKQGRWKGWRYAGFGEINAGMGLAGAIISVGYRGARIHHAAKVKPCIQEAANYVPMIGSIIGASAAAIEFGVNEYHELQAHGKGFSPALAIRHVQGLKNDIDKLFVEREAMINEERKDPSLAAHVTVNEAEGHVLKDLRDQSLQEFQRFHIGARRTLAFQQAQYFFDFAKNTTNAIGYDFAYLSLHRHHRVWNGRAGALFDVSGALFMFGPILSRAMGKGVGEWERNRSSDIVKGTDATIKTLEGDLASLNNLVSTMRTTPDPVLKAVDRTAMYESHQKCFSNELAATLKSRNSSRLIATQNIGAGMYVGGTKLASGILFNIVGFDRNYHSSTPRASRVTNDLLFTASLIAIPAGAFTIFDTLRIQVSGELKRHKLKKAGQLASQLTSNRLKELDQLEARLRAL